MSLNMKWSIENVHPSVLKVGDLVASYGFVGKIEELKVVEHKDCPERAVYCVYVSYVDGNTDHFKYMSAYKHQSLAYLQGNELATWQKAKRKRVNR